MGQRSQVIVFFSPDIFAIYLSHQSLNRIFTFLFENVYIYIMDICARAFLLIRRCDQRHLAAAQLENITKTLTQMLEGYDIRLRPNFGGKLARLT